MPISFPICLLIFLAGWLSGSLFILVSLDPKGLPVLLPPMDSKFTDLTMQLRTEENEKHQYKSYSSVSETGSYSSNINERQGFDTFRDNAPNPINTTVHATFSGWRSNMKTQQVPTKSPMEPLSLRNVLKPDRSALEAAKSVPGGVSLLYKYRWIIMDWAVDDRLFTIENYKALESLLTVYPNSPLRVILAAPNDAYTHKTGNQLSVMHFIKYKRKGYDIQVLPAGMVKSKVAHDYVEKYLKRCCYKCNARCRVSDHVQPYHVLMYIRLSKLYRRGGIFSDFTFLLLAPLEPPVVTQGYYMTTYCNKEENMESWQIEQQARRVRGSSRKDIESGLGMWKVNKCFTSTMLVFNIPQSQVIRCVLDKYGQTEFVLCVEEDSKFDGANCIKEALKDCFERHDIHNDLSVRQENSIDGSGIVADWNGDPEMASKALFSTDWVVHSHKRILWMGSLGWGGHWSPLPYPNKSLIYEVSGLFHLKKNAFEERVECRIQCSHYSENLSILSRFSSSSYNTGIERTACAPTIIVPGFMKSASTFLFSAITMHPQVLPPVKGAQLKETYCYHPSPARKLLKRPWCFPYIDQSENFMTADGTVYYATDPSVASSLLEDNRNVKVVFAIRQPVDRIYSNYKFSYETYSSKGPIDDLLERGMDKDDKFGILRQMVLNGTSEEKMVEHYYHYPFKLGGALGVLFMHSLAFPAIIHYRRVLGYENVLVVNAEDLSVKNMTRLRMKMNEVFKFSGLCPYEIPGQMDETLKGKNSLPIEHDLSQDVYQRLVKFYVPFNNLLAKITGFDLSHWNTKKPSNRLKEYKFGWNTSLPPPWFDLEV